MYAARHIICAMKHMRRLKPVNLSDAMDRVDGLTQLRLEELSGVDRSRISKLCSQNDPRVFHETFEKLDGALRRVGALKPTERLVFGQPQSVAS